MRPLRGGAAVFFSLAGLVSLASTAPDEVWATHEMDHRFVVSGYVRDKDGKPLKDVRVRVRDLGDESVDPVSTYADGSGFYKALLHLHNKNAGDSIQISVKDEKTGFEESKKVRAEFDPADRYTERQAKVDFGPGAETTTGSGPGGVVGAEDTSKYWLYVAGGVLVVAAIGTVVVRSRRQSDGVGSKRRKKKRPSN